MVSRPQPAAAELNVLR